MQPRFAQEIGVLVLIQRDSQSGHWTPPSGRHQTGCGRIAERGKGRSLPDAAARRMCTGRAGDMHAGRRGRPG